MIISDPPPHISYVVQAHSAAMGDWVDIANYDRSVEGGLERLARRRLLSPHSEHRLVKRTVTDEPVIE